MKMVLLTALLMVMAGLIAAQAAGKSLTPQQQRMTSCNQQAAAKTLAGDARRVFMRDCLKNGPSAPDQKQLTPQQRKMVTCNAEASRKALKGDERKTFMSDCLKKK